MKNYYDLFQYDKEQGNFINEFITLREQPDYNKIKKKVKVSYKEDLEKFLYYYKVYELTECNAPKLKNIDRRGHSFHIDHIIPLKYAYEHGIDYSIVGNLKNLQVISKKDNFTKGNFITKQVKDLFSFFNIKYEFLKVLERKKIVYKKEIPTIKIFPTTDKTKVSYYP